MKSLDTLFIKEKGWQHLVGFTSIGFLAYYIGTTHNGYFESVFFNVMFKSLFELSIIPILFFTGFAVFVIGFFMEAAQGMIRKAPFSLPDIIFGVVGVI